MPRSFATLEDEGTSAANASIRRGVGILQFARNLAAKLIKSFLVLFLEKEHISK